MTEQLAVTVRRELIKRGTTYPKLIAKERLTEHEAAMQCARLENVLEVLDGVLLDPQTDMEALQELVREMNCRMQFYPRMIALKRITPEIAAEQIEAWKKVLTWYVARWAFVELSWLKTRVKIKINYDTHLF